MPVHRDHATRRLLEAIDSFPDGKFLNLRKRREMLQYQIDSFDLKWENRPDTSNEEVIDLDVERFMYEVQKLPERCRGDRSRRPDFKVNDLFEKGSKVLPPDFLIKIGYTTPSKNPDLSSADSVKNEETAGVMELDSADERTAAEEVPAAEVQTIESSSAHPMRVKESANVLCSGLNNLDSMHSDSSPKGKASKRHLDPAVARHRGDKKELIVCLRFSRRSSLPSASSIRAASRSEQDVLAGSKRKYGMIHVDDEEADTRNRGLSSPLSSDPGSAEDDADPEQAIISSSKRKHETIETNSEATEAAPRSVVPGPHSLNQDSTGPELRRLAMFKDDDVSRRLSSIWRSVHSSTRMIFNAAGADPDKATRWVSRPELVLRASYVALFGQDWKARISVLKLTGPISAHEALEGCIAAAVYEMVFCKPLPWPSAKSILEDMQGQGQVRILNSLLAESGNRGIGIETLVWQMAPLQVLDAAFQSSRIRPMANDLARNLWTTMEPHFAGISGFRGGFQGLQAAEEFYNRSIADLTSIFSKALVLKGLIEAAPGYYTISWIQSGAQLNREEMKEVHASEESSQQEVAWCVSPLIKMRPSMDSEEEIVCEAKVFTRPKGKE